MLSQTLSVLSQPIRLCARIAGPGRRSFRMAFWLCLGILAVTCFGGNVTAYDAEPILRVEEDWQIEISVPDSQQDAPQIIGVMSPIGSLEWLHFVFEINHATLHSYRAGGMQVQSWIADTPYTHRLHPNADKLATDNEVITYTAAMSISGDVLTFEIVNGGSATWGQFGGQGYLRSAWTTGLTNLDLYDPEISINNSRVGFASYRVKKMVRKQVRYYSASGLVTTDSTERVVHEYNGGN